MALFIDMGDQHGDQHGLQAWEIKAVVLRLLPCLPLTMYAYIQFGDNSSPFPNIHMYIATYQKT